MKKTLIYTVIPTILLALNIVLGGLLVEAKEFDLTFLIALCLVFGVTVVYRNKFSRPLIVIARTLVGMLFIFSGFVKGVDPLGTQYQMQDYFMAYGTTWANPFALPLAVIMIAAEFVVGAALILNIRIPLASWGAVLLMIFFTITTFFDAIYNLVPDCGCFGEAVKLSNWQTFYKNIVIDTFLAILFFGRYRIRNTFSLKNEVIIIASVAILFVGFEIGTLRHLPVIDFLDWKVGVKLNPPKTEPITYSFEYKNKTTQEVQTFDSKSLPADVTTNWEFVNSIINDPNPKNLMIPIFDQSGGEGQEITDMVAGNPDYSFIVAMYDIKKARKRNMPKIFALQDLARQKGFEFVFLFDLNATTEQIDQFKQKVGREDLDMYYSDDKSIKAIVRSNPGLILLKDGVVVDKWAWRDVPTVETVQEIIK
ncbi:MAG: DoxX family protein [Bacteroidales bacterium]|jgi:uncharacterized membrane protein YphA (DoxX/SURF4 family)|nr:DoxX family protein [Bacteroidales bacterium]